MKFLALDGDILLYKSAASARSKLITVTTFGHFTLT